MADPAGAARSISPVDAGGGIRWLGLLGRGSLVGLVAADPGQRCCARSRSAPPPCRAADVSLQIRSGMSGALESRCSPPTPQPGVSPMPKRSRGLSRSPFQDRRLVRLDEAWLGLPNRWGIPVEVCAGAEVPIEPAAVDGLGSVVQTGR